MRYLVELLVSDLLIYGEKDNSKIVYFLILLLSICSIWFCFSNDLYDLLIEGGVNSSSNFLPLTLIALFRTLCAYLAFHSLFFWMILDKKGGFMYAHFYEKRESLPHKIWGLNRLVPFSSWNVLIFSLTFILLSIISWMEVLKLNPPEFIHIIATILFSISLAMTTLTATIVTYLIIPTAIKKRETYDYLFEKHQMVMHNWVLIFIIADVIITTPSLAWEFAVFGIMIGIVYSIFANFYAVYGGGFYVYHFIDSRLKFAPIIMTLLGLMIALFYIFVWIGLKILDWNYFIGSLIFIVWVYSIVLFKPKLFDKKSLQ